MPASALRLLVVDDFELWRRFIRTTIQGISDVLIVGEASDGREAVEQAGKLRPDLVLLDIGLPFDERDRGCARNSENFPGIEHFFTENPSRDVMEECFRTGASGYVVKSSAANDLISAINAVLKRKVC